MIGALKKQLYVLGDELLVGYLVAIGGYLFGMLLMWIIVRADKTTDAYLLLGALIGAIVFAVYCITINVEGFRQYFNVEISMGCTRRDFFLSYLMISVVHGLLGVILILGLGRAEKLLYAAVYPDMGLEYGIDFLYYIGKIGFPVAVALPVVGVCASALLLRFGRKAFWVFWTIWMLGCVGGPQLHDAAVEAPNSILGMAGGRLFQMIRAVPGRIWMILGAVLGAACLLTSYLIVRKQQVN